MNKTSRRFTSMLAMALSLSAAAGCADTVDSAGTTQGGQGGAGGDTGGGAGATNGGAGTDTGNGGSAGTNATGDAGHGGDAEEDGGGAGAAGATDDDAGVGSTDGGAEAGDDGDAATTTDAGDAGPGTDQTIVEPEPTKKVLNVNYQAQPNGWWCGPTATRIALSARMASPPSLQWLADTLPTTVNGTDWIGQVTRTLNEVLEEDRYRTTEMPNDPPTQTQRDRLWDDIMVSIGNNYALVTNIVAPPSNHPPGYPNNETIYHYFTVVGYDATSTKKVYIADPAAFAGNTLYWISFDLLATLIPPKGYSSYDCPQGMTSGAIDVKYRALGGCRSVVGGPVAAEKGVSDGVGKYNDFEKGTISWSPTTGAHEVHGAILTKWKELGREGGSLGYPTSDEYGVAGGKRSNFQRGSLVWNESSSTVTQQ